MKWHRYKQESEKRKNYVLLAALAVACVAALSIGSVTLSRYVLKSEDQQVATPPAFYFESDYLKEGGAAYTVYTGSVNIKIANHDGLNITRDTISYTIDGTGNAGTQTLNGGFGEQRGVHAVGETGRNEEGHCHVHLSLRQNPVRNLSVPGPGRKHCLQGDRPGLLPHP